MCVSEDGGRDSLGAMYVMKDWDVMNAPLNPPWCCTSYVVGAKSRRSISRAMRMAVEASLPAGMEMLGHWGEVEVMTTW